MRHPSPGPSGDPRKACQALRRGRRRGALRRRRGEGARGCSESRLESSRQRAQGCRAGERRRRETVEGGLPGGSSTVKPVQKRALLGLHTTEGIEETRHTGLEPSYACGNVGRAATRRGGWGRVKIDAAWGARVVRRRGDRRGTLVGGGGVSAGAGPREWIWRWNQALLRGGGGGGRSRGTGQTALGGGGWPRLPWS